MFLDTSIIKSPFVTFYEFLILLKGVKWNLENEVFCRRALRLIFIFYSTMNSQEVKFKSEQLTISLVAGNNKSSAIIVCGFLALAVLRATKYEASTAATFCCWYLQVPRQLVSGHFVYDTSSTDISSTDISSTTVYQRVAQLYIQLLFQQIIIFINSNFYLHYDSFLSIPLPLTL